LASSTPVLIVGAGPVGLTAAVALAQAGVDLRVVDAGSDVDRRMRATTFHPPTIDMIDSLGLAESLIGMGLEVPRWQMRQHDTGEHITFDLGAISVRTAHPYRLQVEQHHYCRLAIDALEELGVHVEFDTGVESVTQNDTGVDITLANDGGRIRARWLIGADGAGSAVRESLGLEYGGRTYTHSSVLVLTTFPFHDHIPNLADVTYCWSTRGPFSLLRLRGRWRASLYPGVEDLVEAACEERVRDWLAFISPDARDAELMQVSPYRVHERCVDRFRVGRVMLAGDAAHLNPPNGGMGMNGGIHDAMNLVDKLLQVLEDGDDSLLDRYDRQRRYAASERVIPQASANRERMSATSVDSQARRLSRYKAIAADDARCNGFLLDRSMISILDEAAAIE
jgi:3-(3-hydroxy-phenyl)propionate hydroxylase